MTIDIVLLGVGAIGRELLAQLSEKRRGPSPIRVCGLVDRSGYVFDANGIARDRLVALGDHKAHGGSLAETVDGCRADSRDAVAFMCALIPTSAVLIDATAADTRATLEMVLERGWNVVLANKVPLAAEQGSVDQLYTLAAARGVRILHEATVGAGLPVIDTLHKLLDAGDRVSCIEGCPSGTLGFLFGELERGRSFSAALGSAMARGYTEPDPRDDLSGLDVARKALILARAIGFRGNLENVRVERLVGRDVDGLTRASFLEATPTFDASWSARLARARARNRVLRYRLRATRRSVRVGLALVPASDPLSQLNGTDNQFSFTTARYRERPLVISGPGAGPAVTAAGVYNDLLKLIR